MKAAMNNNLVVGSKVRHNYPNGHGDGVVVSIDGNGSERMAYKVLFNSGEGPYPYTNNCEFQEIVILENSTV